MSSAARAGLGFDESDAFGQVGLGPRGRDRDDVGLLRSHRQQFVAAAGDHDRRRGLHRRRDVTGVRQQSTDFGDLFGQPFHPFARAGERQAGSDEFFFDVAGAQRDDQPSAGRRVHACQVPGQQRGPVERRVEDQIADLDGGCGLGDGDQWHQRRGEAQMIG